MTSPADAKVELVARAIFAERFCGKDADGPTRDKEWADLSEEAREAWRFYARAAIAALEASADTEATPIPMLLYCPQCGQHHVDEPDERTPDWTNPPHKSHLCHDCGCIWRPADVPTEGVRAIKTQGKADTWTGERGNAESAMTKAPTEAMIEAGMRAFGNTELVGSSFTRRALAAAYTAMQAARPIAPVQDDEWDRHVSILRAWGSPTSVWAADTLERLLTPTADHSLVEALRDARGGFEAVQDLLTSTRGTRSAAVDRQIARIDAALGKQSTANPTGETR